ncbi:hypothetical protein ACFXOY_04765 [Streptomyces niveus]|uniref:hypothetical protein n=1 Tax=Streptomyces niveus TaxID=193462 RepID=UPI0036AB0D2D
MRRPGPSRRSRALTGTVGLLCAVALAGLVGCSGESDAPSDAPSDGAGKASPVPEGDLAGTVVEAVAETRRTSARFDQEITMSDGKQTQLLFIKGDFDMAGDMGRLTVEIPEIDGARAEELFVAGKVYLRAVKETAGPWGYFDRNKSEVHLPLRAPMNDPEHTLFQVGMAKNVYYQGVETMNGAPAKHYRGMLDHLALSLRLGESQQEDANRERAARGEDVPIYADVWIDEAGRVVQTRTAFDFGYNSTTVTTVFSDFGKPVKVTAPPAAGLATLSPVPHILTG